MWCDGRRGCGQNSAGDLSWYKEFDKHLEQAGPIDVLDTGSNPIREDGDSEHV